MNAHVVERTATEEDGQDISPGAVLSEYWDEAERLKADRERQASPRNRGQSAEPASRGTVRYAYD